MDSETYDVIVIGGGPGGATLATLVAKRGHRVLLLEKSAFPRHRIGESLLPVTVHAVGRLLGVWEEIESAGFVRKAGGTFKWGNSEDLWTVLWTDNPFLERNGINYSYQVDRARFDEILLRNARRCGVNVREEAQAKSLVRDGNRITGVRWSEARGTRSVEASSTFVVDASGYESRFYKAAGERAYSEFFQNVALYAYFRNGKRLAPPNDGNALSVAIPSGWIWYLPISDEMTSVGAVVAKDSVVDSELDRERLFYGFIEQSPLIADFLAGAERVTDGMYGTIRVRRDYSYCNSRFWVPGLVLIGDSACFVDPITATGVHLATFSAVLAARAINACLSCQESEHAFFLDVFEGRYRREFDAVYDFLLAFYDSHKDQSSYFWKARQVLGAVEPAQSAFGRLLAGAGTSLDQFFSDRRGIGSLLNEYKEFYLRPGSGQQPFDDQAALKHVSPKTLGLAVENVQLRYDTEQILWDASGYDAQIRRDCPMVEVSSDGLAWHRHHASALS